MARPRVTIRCCNNGGSGITLDPNKFLARDSTEPAASEHDVSDLALDLLAESTAAGMRGKVDAAATLHTHTLDQVGDYPLDAGSFPTNIIGAKTGDSATEFNITITATSAWASAIANEVENPGRNPGVISDGMILSRVQGLA